MTAMTAAHASAPPLRATVVLRNPQTSSHHHHQHRSSSMIRMGGVRLQRRELIALVAAAILFLFMVTTLVIHSVLLRTSDEDSGVDPLGEGPLGSDGEMTGTARGGERKKKRGARVDGDGTNLDAAYASIRAEHDSKFPPSDHARMIDFARSLRTREYTSLYADEMPYDVNDCPPTPPEGYPLAWPILDVIGHWNPDDATPHPQIHQGLCRFDAATEYDKALTYRKAEVPFVIRDDPVILPTVERWNQPEYLTNILGRTKKYRTDYAETNHLMFYRTNKYHDLPENWKEPTTQVDISYPDWLDKANNPDKAEVAPDKPHWYFRLNAKAAEGEGFLFDEMPFFKPTKNFYMVDPTDARGINCRFGMVGNTAENHFDGSRNFIALFGGERRYFLSHPHQCPNLALYPPDHPSGRHSAVNWADPDLDAYPQFADAETNEVVLQAGDVLYLPTNWFHHIVSLGTNFQCNARCGITKTYHKEIRDCGFKRG